MKLDLKKISNIENKNQLKKYEIEEPIFFNNYLFHYLILTDNYKALKLEKYPVFKLNEDDMNAFHLAAQLSNYKILKYLIKKYEDYIYNKNAKGENFMHYLLPDNMKKYYHFIENTNIDWDYLFNDSDNEDIKPIQNVFFNCDYETIDKILDIVNIKYDKYIDEPSYFILFNNDNLSNKDIIKILKKIYTQDKNVFKYTDNMGYNIVYPVVLNDNMTVLKFLNNINKNNDKVIIDMYSPITTKHIFKIAYDKAIISGNYMMAEYIIDNIIDTHNFYEIDMHGNNLAHYILKKRLSTHRGNDKIEKNILSKYDLWTKNNIDNITPLDYIVKLDYMKYSKFLKGRVINKKYNIKKVKNDSWRKLLEKLEKCETDDMIKMENYKYSHSNMFQARFTDMSIFMSYLDNKYKNLYLPRYKKELDISTYNNTITYPDDIMKTYNNFAWIIIWNNINNYFIHPYLRQLIKENMEKYDYAICGLSLRLPSGGLHAAMILYDFNRKIIERFEPYGNTQYLDMDIDKVLEKELHIDGFTYNPPGRYFPVAGFQTLSDENNLLNQKLGDFGGYCLAWSLWYVEHRMNNTNIEPKTLIRKTINRFNSMIIKPNEYIRNYANYVNNYRIKWLKDIIPENIISNENIQNQYLKKIYAKIIKENEE